VSAKWTCHACGSNGIGGPDGFVAHERRAHKQESASLFAADLGRAAGYAPWKLMGARYYRDRQPVRVQAGFVVNSSRVAE
jgi:hypothetical protein